MVSGVENFNVVAMRRSGHHAIIRWMAGHFNKTIFHNDYGQDGSSQPRSNDDHIAGIYTFHDEGTGDCRIVNFEDFSVSEAPRPTVLVLRDPYNCFASRLKARFELEHALDEVSVTLWLEHAKSFHSNGVYPISYNRWFIDEEYRARISQELLHRPYSSKHLDRVSQFGLYSSFDGPEYEGRATDMKVLSRWRECVDDPRFAMILKDNEIRQLTLELFGELTV